MEADTSIVEEGPTAETRAVEPGSEQLHEWKSTYRDLGPLASWTVSSAKPGFGITCVQDENLETYWQSDGPQPHYINIHFPHLVSFTHIAIYLNFALDESYTPATIKIMTGMGYHTLRETKVLTFNEPKGWRCFDLTQELGPYEPGSAKEIAELGRGTKLFDTRLIQLQILNNHQNGKDTHVRCIKIFTPRAKWTQEYHSDDIMSGLDYDVEGLVR